MAATRHGRSLRGALAAACALAGIQSAPAKAVEVDGAALYYQEPNRVTAFEGVFQARHDFGDERIGNFKLIYDALTGASANGAVPSLGAQTFTSPSGLGTWRAAPGETPLDPTFHDARVALNGSYTQPLGRLTRLTGGLYGSTEHDYTSLGANASIERDLNRRNTTLSAGVSFSSDTISPEGGRPIPFAAMRPAGVTPPRLDGDGSKDVLDLIVGLTQVVDRATLLQLNYSLSRVQGYQTDPYKVVSVVDPVGGDPVRQLFESRPDQRTKKILFARLKRHLGPSVLDLSYRFMDDDWQITSHTADLHWRWTVGALSYLEPHVRFYRQSAAGFYTRWLEDGQDLPDHATADYRLGEMDTWTVGLRYGRPVGPGQTLSARVEYYWQTGDSHPAGAPGQLAELDLFPTVDAWIVNVGYTLDFGEAFPAGP